MFVREGYMGRKNRESEKEKKRNTTTDFQRQDKKIRLLINI